jgi:hypothetical protein
MRKRNGIIKSNWYSAAMKNPHKEVEESGPIVAEWKHSKDKAIIKSRSHIELRHAFLY